MELETLKEIIEGRRSIRRYRPEKAPREKIVELFSIAAFAPSSCNLQAWHFILVDDEGLKKKIVQKGKVNRQVLNAPSFIVATYNRNVTREHYANYQSLAAAIQNFLLLAHSEGLGTLWVCNFKDERGIREVLSIPDSHRVLAIIEVGYPLDRPRPPKRNPVENFVSFNGFSSESTIPRTTFLDHWRWKDILEWQNRFAWRGYPLENVTDVEKMEVAPLIISHLDNGKALELFTLSGYLTSAANRQKALIDYHFTSREIYDAALSFEPSIGERPVTLLEGVDHEVLGKYNQFLLVNKLEHIPVEILESILRILSETEGETKLLILFRNRYSWYGLYDCLMRIILRKNGIDDLFFGTLRNLGPWKLRSKGWIKKIVKKHGFKVIKSHGLFSFPAYRFDHSEWIKSKRYFLSLFKFLAIICSALEFIFKLTGINRYIGEQILLVCRLERNRG
ncbi:MAG: nitroreductase family protein [Thermodesulfobacteriota bacterium]|nr:nitroreductase family protein [Thermodesulfobacteriota bacterium]